MKLRLIYPAACLLLALPVSASAAFTYETPEELTTQLEINYDGHPDLLVLDRATGTLRLLMSMSGLSFQAAGTWQTGMDTADSLSGGISRTTRPMVAVASAAENRISLVLPSVGLQREIQFGNRSWPGSVVVTGPLAGEQNTTARQASLFVGTEFNAPPSAEQLSRFSLSSQGVPTAADAFDQPTGGLALRRGNELTWQGGRALGYITPADGGGSSFVFQCGTPDPRSASVLVSGLPEDALWLHGRFASQEGRSGFLFYHRGATAFTPREAQFVTGAPLPVFTGYPPVETGGAIHLLITVEQPGATHDRVLALLDGGTRAILFDWRNGSSLTAVQSWTAPAGETFTQARSLGGGAVLLLHGEGGRSMAWKRMDQDGNQLRQTLSGNFHCGLLRRQNASLFYFSQEPFVFASARLNRTARESDWTDVGSGLLSPVLRLTDTGPRGGLGQASGWLPPPGNYDSVLVTNQLTRTATGGQAPISLASLSNAVGEAVPQIRFDPPSGLYPSPHASVMPVEGLPPDKQPVAGPRSFPVTLSNPSGAAMSWRLSADDPWTPYTGPVPLSGEGVILAKFDTSPRIYPAGYRFWVRPDGGGNPSLPPATDLDGDGLPDAWEDAFAEYRPGADSDGDGRTALQEYQEGTDPRDAFSVTPPATVVPTPDYPLELVMTVAPGPDGSRQLKLSWSLNLSEALLEASDNMEVWEPAAGSFTIEGPSLVHTAPLPAGGSIPDDNIPLRRFYRLVRMEVCE